MNQSSLALKRLTRDLDVSEPESVNKIEEDITEAQNSNVVSSVIGQTNEAGTVIDKIDFLINMPSAVQAAGACCFE